MTGRSRYDEYLICKERGHAEPEAITASIPPQSICPRCGTYYFYDTRLIEHGIPISPENDSSEAT